MFVSNTQIYTTYMYKLFIYIYIYIAVLGGGPKAFSLSVGFSTFEHAFENMPAILDSKVLIIVLYALLCVVPIILSIIIVNTRPFSINEERIFHKKWYKWSKQFTFHEMMYRTNVLIILSMIVAITFEYSEWSRYSPFIIMGSLLFITICSKCVTYLIKPRIITAEQEKYFDKLAMAESYMIHKQNVDEFESYQMKPNIQSIIKPRRQIWPFRKRKNDKYVPLLSHEPPIATMCL